MFSITGGRRDVPIALIENGRVDWEYDFSPKDQRPCGRQGCEKKHKWGWIVALPGGGFTNIGHDCAAKYANHALWGATTSAFAARIRKIARDTAVIEARDLAQTIICFLDTSPRLVAAIELHESFCTQVRGPLLDDLERRAEKGDGNLKIEQRLSIEERERRRMMQEILPSAAAVHVHVASSELVSVGELLGIRAFRSGANPRELKARLDRLADAVLKNYPGDDDVKAKKVLDQDRQALSDMWRWLQRILDSIDAFYSDRTLGVLMRHPLVRNLGILQIRRDANQIIVAKKTWGAPSRAA